LRTGQQQDLGEFVLLPTGSGISSPVTLLTCLLPSLHTIAQLGTGNLAHRFAPKRCPREARCPEFPAAKRFSSSHEAEDGRARGGSCRIVAEDIPRHLPRASSPTRDRTTQPAADDLGEALGGLKLRDVANAWQHD
jgi:hypothetical protein